MKVLLAAVNAKYIHSNLAVHSLKAYARTYTEEIEVAEYTINQTFDAILQDIYRRKPDLLGISCYLWNIEYVGQNCRRFFRIQKSGLEVLRYLTMRRLCWNSIRK